MRPVDVFAIAVAVVIALLSLIVEPWSAPWWAALLTASFIAVWALLHMLLGRGGQRTVKLTAILFLVVGIPAFGAWFWHRYPESAKIMQAYFPAAGTAPKPNPAPTPVTRKINATLGKAYYKCKTKDIERTKAEAEKFEADFKTYIEAWANFYGFKPPTVSQVPSGLKAEIPPVGNATEPSKRAFQIVKIGKELFGIYTADYSYYPNSSIPLQANSAVESQVHKAIEGLAQVEPGDCELQ